MGVDRSSRRRARSPGRSPEVKRTMRLPDSSARCRMIAASARPSMSGMRASSSTSAYGRPRATPCQRAFMAAAPSPTAAGSIFQPRSHSSRIRRLVALSSTISTGRSCSRTGGRVATAPGMRLAAEPRREGEGAAPARLALHRDRPAHQGHQPRGDRQAQAGAAVLARGRPVLLLEGAEDLLLLVARDADAGVAHGEQQRRLRASAARARRSTSTRTTTSPCSVNLMALPTG